MADPNAIRGGADPQTSQQTSSQQSQSSNTVANLDMNLPTEFIHFSRLPEDIRLMIVGEAYEEIRQRLHQPLEWVVISRDWKTCVEGKTFRKYMTLTPDLLDEFEQICTGSRSLAISAICLEIDLHRLNVELWTCDHQGDEHIPDSTSTSLSNNEEHLKEATAASQASRAVTNVFARLFNIINSWPGERSASHLLGFEYAIQWIQDYPRFTTAMCDFSNLPEVTKIGSIYSMIQTDMLDESVLPSSSSLALMGRFPSLQGASLVWGVGKRNRSRDLGFALETIKYLPVSAPRLRWLEIQLYKRGYYRECSLPSGTDILPLMKSLSHLSNLQHLEALSLEKVTTVSQFLQTFLGGTKPRQLGAQSLWPKLRRLDILGLHETHYTVISHSDAQHGLFTAISNVVSHLPGLRSLIVRIYKGGFYGAELNLKLVCSTEDASSGTIHDGAFLCVQGLTPHRHEVELWKAVVLREWQMKLTTCFFNICDWHRVPMDATLIRVLNYEENSGDEEGGDESELDGSDASEVVEASDDE